MHKCRNPKFCPFCRQKIKKEILNFFEKNSDILISYEELIKRFDLKYVTAQKIFDSLERNGFITRKYIRTKRLTTGSGIKTYFLLSPNKYRPYKVNSKAWIKIF